jgi:IS66 C-terminal element
MYPLIGTCKLKGVDLEAYLRYLFARINNHKINALRELCAIPRLSRRCSMSPLEGWGAFAIAPISNERLQLASLPAFMTNSDQ